MTERSISVRTGAIVMTTWLVCALAVGAVATGFGTLPECGTGTYFLYPLEPFTRTAIVAFVAGLAGSIIVCWSVRTGRLVAVILLVGSMAAAAAGAAALSEAANHCAAWRDHSYAVAAAVVAFIAGSIPAVFVLAVAALRAQRSTLSGSLPAIPAGSRWAGDYTAERSETDAVGVGAHVRVAVDREALLLVPDRGGPARVALSRVSVDLDGAVSLLAIDRVPVLALRPDPGVVPWALVEAVERARG